jgi:N-formylglutamate amidohydrolase
MQLEVAQACYMDEQNPRRFDGERAAPLRNVLERLVIALSEWRPRSRPSARPS